MTNMKNLKEGQLLKINTNAYDNGTATIRYVKRCIDMDITPKTIFTFIEYDGVDKDCFHVKMQSGSTRSFGSFIDRFVPYVQPVLLDDSLFTD